jgi:hypothetical protein
MEKVKLICESGFQKSLTSSTETGLQNLFSAGGTVLNESENAWKNGVQK